MTGMEHAIERAAEIIGGHVDHFIGIEPDQPLDAARALAEAGLLAPVPLTEEWAVQWVRRGGEIRTYPCDDEADARDSIRGDETTVHRYVSAWLPVDRAEGDGRADQ